MIAAPSTHTRVFAPLSTLFFLFLFLLVPLQTQAAEFTTVSHDLYVSTNGDIYLKARDRIVVLHGDILVPLALDPTESSYFLARDTGQADGYADAVAYDEVNSPMDISTYTEYDGLEIDGSGDLYIPSVAAIPHSLVLENGASNANLIAYDIENTGNNYVTNTPSTPVMSGDNVVTAAEIVASDQVGAIAGDFKVTDDGAASYTIPIFTPQGTADVAPQISLNYSSNRGNGIAGLGWSIGGLSAITRCRQTMHQDMNTEAIQWNAEDRFCLDGQRLILVSGGHGQDGSTYRTEVDGFATVTAKSGSTGDPAYFEVERKDGSKSYYGYTSEQSVDGANGKTRIWAIYQFEDNIGNQIVYRYSNTADGHYVSEIRYAFGGTGASYNARIRFTYEDRDDDRFRYVAGELFSDKKRLDYIEVLAEEGGVESELRQYNLYYDEVGLGSSNNDELSRLTSIEECVGTTCLPKTQFQWEIPDIGFDGYSEFQIDEYSGSGYVADNLISETYADINGDGIQDYVYSDYDNDLKYVFITKNSSGGYSFTQGQFTNGSTALTVYIPELSQPRIHSLDYNLDGYDDILMRGNVYLAVPQSDGSVRISANPTTTNFDFWDVSQGDINADGMTDVLSSRFWDSVAGEWQYSLNFMERNTSAAVSSSEYYRFSQQVDQEITFTHGIYTDQPAYRTTTYQVADMDADGKAEIFSLINPTGTCPGGSPCSEDNEIPLILDFDGYNSSGDAVFSGGTHRTERSFAIDLNRDGVLDHIRGGLYSTNGIYRYSTGNGYISDGAGGEIAITAGGTIGDQDSIAHVGDYNNDGYADLYWLDGANLKVKLWSPSVDGFESGEQTITSGGQSLTVSTTTKGNYGFYYPDTFGKYSMRDLDGDGKTDFIERTGGVYGDDLVLRIHANKDQGKPTNKIVKITNGLLATAEVTYEPIGGSDHYAAVRYDTSPSSAWSESSSVTSSLGDFYTEINQAYANSDSLIVDTINADQPMLPVRSGFSVVTDVSTSLPIEGNNASTSSQSYFYGDAKRQLGQVGRGNTGFGKRKIVDNQTGIETTISYRQDWPYTGRQIRTEVSSSGNLVSATENTWSVRTRSSGYSSSWKTTLENNGSVDLGPVAPFLERSISKTYDPYDGTSIALSTVVTEGARDGYGNPTTVSVTHYDGDQSDTTSSAYIKQEVTSHTYNDAGAGLGTTYSEQLGRLTEKLVTTTRNDSGTTETSSRKMAYDYYDDGQAAPSSGAMADSFVGHKGMLRSEQVFLDNSLLTTTYYYYDARGNRVLTRTDGDSDNDGSNDTRYSSLLSYESTGRYINSVYSLFANSSGVANKYLTSTVISRDHYGTPTETQVYIDESNYVTSKSYTSPRGAVYFTTDVTGAWTATNASSVFTSQCPINTKYWVRSRTADGGDAYECFDILGRSKAKALKTFDGSWAYTLNYYDTAGRPNKQSIPLASLSTYPIESTITSYDALGRVTATQRPGISAPDTIDYEGLETIYTTARGNTKREVRNVLGETISIYENHTGDVSSVDGEALGSNERSESHYLYGVNGNLTRMTDAENNVTTMTYDSLGRKLSTDDPDKGYWEYTYNAFSEVICQEDAKGQIILNAYDFSGRMSSRTDRHPGGSCASPSGAEAGYTAWTYDQADYGFGQIGVVETKSSSSDSVANFKQTTYFDTFGRVSRTKTEIEGNSDEHWTKTTYDEYGRVFQSFDAARTSDSYNNNGIQNHYNSYGYLNKVTDVRYTDGVPKETYYEINSMDDWGNVTDAMYGDLVEVYAGYEADTGYMDWLSAKVSGTSYQNYDLDWDEIGNLNYRRNLTGTVGGAGGQITNETETYTYDALNRLERHSTGTTNTTLSYDSIGNIDSKSDWGGAYTYGTKPSYCNISGAVTPGPHAVSDANGTSYCYDANGNGVQDSSGRTLSYSVFDKVTQIAKNGHTSSFEYGPDRGRYRRIDTQAGGTTTTLYLPGVEKVYNDDNTIEWKRDIGVGQITQVVDGTGSIQEETTHYFLRDHLDSVTHIIEMNANGTISAVEEMAFDPWGARVAPNDIKTDLTASQIASLFGLVGNSFAGSPTTSKGFTGHEMLDEVDIIHMNGRIYDARAARFVQADPFIQAPYATASANRYSYTWNNPMNATDPSGYNAACLTTVTTGGGASQSGVLCTRPPGEEELEYYDSLDHVDHDRSYFDEEYSYEYSVDQTYDTVKWDIGASAITSLVEAGASFAGASNAVFYMLQNGTNTKITGGKFASGDSSSIRSYFDPGEGFFADLVRSFANTSVGVSGTIDVPLSKVDKIRSYFGFEKKGIPDVGFSIAALIQPFYHPDGLDFGFVFTRRAVGGEGVGSPDSSKKSKGSFIKANLGFEMHSGSIQDQAGNANAVSVFIIDAGATWVFDEDGNISGGSFDLGLGVSAAVARETSSTFTLRTSYTESGCSAVVC